MNIKTKFLIIFILFFAFVVFNNSDSLAFSQTYTGMNFTNPKNKKTITNITLSLNIADEYFVNFDNIYAYCLPSNNGYLQINIVIGNGSIKDVNENGSRLVFGINPYDPVKYCLRAFIRGDAFNLSELSDNSCISLTVPYEAPKDSEYGIIEPAIGSVYDFNQTYRFFSTCDISSKNGVFYEKNLDYNPVIPVEPDKLNLFELNLKDLDYNNQEHLFNICTYTDSPYYDELMGYYNGNSQYFIYMTDYQRVMTYEERENDNSYKYGSYLISGYIDFLIDEDAYAFYYPPTEEIRYRKSTWWTYQNTSEKQKYSDVSDFVKRFYFKLVYSEDTNDPHATIYEDNGALKYETELSEPEWIYFIGGSTNIRYAKYHKFLWVIPTNVMTLSDKYYYTGYLGEDGKREEEVDDIPFYRYNFDFSGGTTKTFFTSDPTYEQDIMNTYDDLMLDYLERDIQQDTSEGASYKQGQGYATSTFDYGQVTDDSTPEEDAQYFGQILTANNSSVDYTSDWTILDYLKNIYYALTGKGGDTSNITKSTDTLKNKFNFSNNIINNANEIKDFVANTQETHKYYLNINHKYLNGQVCVIDLSWYAPYKETVDAFICAFAYLAFIWHMFCILPSLISGASAGSYASDIQAYKETGFGRSSNIHKGGF